MSLDLFFFFFFFKDPAPTEFYPLPLHAALPISSNEVTQGPRRRNWARRSCSSRRFDTSRAYWRWAGGPGSSSPFCSQQQSQQPPLQQSSQQDRKSTRLNSSHLVISYAVFCLEKK